MICLFLTLFYNIKKRLFVIFGLVATENLLLLIYPLVGSFAVNAVLMGCWFLYSLTP
ncbi:ABC transporter six-transmembrane domain-containing protein [Glaesserella parasuis]|uniref:ABC transporter six-transmembrane domain-containing protein n=1 Tax=Glaesserella parasuis TaxID=738 RepID=UPI001F2D377C|nr:ABC transporter six-transmembrane domain-containing protein [Glaesserella parasuis]MDO9768521.1 ABC transporter six-transmembrane domain-containing protein [Glaesserella parasuis]